MNAGHQSDLSSLASSSDEDNDQDFRPHPRLRGAVQPATRQPAWANAARTTNAMIVDDWDADARKSDLDSESSLGTLPTTSTRARAARGTAAALATAAGASAAPPPPTAPVRRSKRPRLPRGATGHDDEDDEDDEYRAPSSSAPRKTRTDPASASGGVATLAAPDSAETRRSARRRTPARDSTPALDSVDAVASGAGAGVARSSSPALAPDGTVLVTDEELLAQLRMEDTYCFGACCCSPPD
ncbi:hypothetical protein AMAG_07269 [Allomyces macrogynus ATCC 38327]|uniref:Uncharacterized protein n=1 Tax=Allomyces macrogynus (strain ATCC 38327) TaxID=578462 RepID=A0A0L0SHU3_ALLM3|nr:hypothetical protein AMAG_07269 [Allomyces macrogynus ATCC 38327]|eukprot:KNE62009.1 hypothetical protein AMAG_07269 [Allomyces macrogynus ATCC 38327]